MGVDTLECVYGYAWRSAAHRWERGEEGNFDAADPSAALCSCLHDFLDLYRFGRRSIATADGTL